MRVATENVLADFLREIRDIARVHKQQAEERRARVLVNGLGGGTTAAAGVKRSESKMTVSSSVGKGLDERAGGAAGEDLVEEDEREEDWEGKGSGSWIPGQGIAVHYEEIVEILLRHVAYPSELGRLALVWAVVLIGTLFFPLQNRRDHPRDRPPLAVRVHCLCARHYDPCDAIPHPGRLAQLGTSVRCHVRVQSLNEIWIRI